jgi:DNA-directed RNA polymerase subunit RPC12/RpoP
VVDADARRLSFISDVARDEHFAVDVVHHDVREPLPAPLRGAFDVIETDPPYTLAGARLFLGRGAEALVPAAGGQGFFSFAEWSGEQLLELEQLLLELGFAIRRIRSGFNRYVGATVLGSVGQLFELVQVVPPSKEMPTWDAPLYTAQFKTGARVYVCASCNAQITLGEDGTPSTIEALKAAGCPVCTGRVFRRRAGRT